jgi:hypothetical protein
MGLMTAAGWREDLPDTPETRAQYGTGNASTPNAPVGPAAHTPGWSPEYGADTGPSGGVGGGNQTPDWLRDYLNAENQRKIAEAQEELRRWNLNFGLATNADQRSAALLEIQRAQQSLSQAQFDASKQQFSQNLYANMAQSLLQGAAGLRGPRDWQRYQAYTGGGHALLDQLFGGNRPAFSAPNGDNAPIGIGDILDQLGLTSGKGGGAPAQTGTFAAPAPNTIDPAKWDALSGSGQQMLLGAAEAGGYDAADYQKQIDAQRLSGAAPSVGSTGYQKDQPLY